MFQHQILHTSLDLSAKSQGGVQESNLTKAEARGLKKLKKRVADGSLVIVKTDKSGRFSVMSMCEYERAGKIHTEKDIEVDVKFLQENQRRINGYLSMLIKIFRIGDAHSHYDRIRSLKLTWSLSVAPLYLLFKDHKGWSLETGSAPPSRPVVSAGSGQNDHWSEVISEVIEPVVKTWERGMEAQSTGDLVSKVIKINEMDLGLEEVDLEQVDKELDRQEQDADERYNNFDDDLTFRKEEMEKTIPSGWKNKTEQTETVSTIETVSLLEEGSRLDTTPPGGGVRNALDGGDKPEIANSPKHTPKTRDKIPEDEQQEYSGRMETKLDKLRMKWSGTNYEIIAEKLEGMENWKKDDNRDIKEAIVDWLLENNEEVLVEEGEDIIDGLEMMEISGEISRELLLDSTEVVTILIARNLCYKEMNTSFQKSGNQKVTRIFQEAGNLKDGKGRLDRMKKMRELLFNSKDARKPRNSRDVQEEDFPEMEFKFVSRRESSRRKDRVEGLKSDMVDNDMIQDKSVKLQIIGSDVAALYPSLDAVEVARIVYNAIMETKVKFSGVNYLEACRLIALTSTDQECRISKLKRVLPRRRSNQGTRPGITGEDPMGPEVGSQEQWKFPSLPNGLTELEKKMVVATVMQKNVLALFKTHTYSFSNKYFLQMKGGPIGLRSTCCVARLVMLWWDERFLEAVEKAGIKVIDGARYMDDVRVWLRAVRLGWRWIAGQLTYRKAWRLEEEEQGMTHLAKTTEIMENIMNSICSWLELTMETEEMFEGVLPTLDLKLWVSSSNRILFSFFEKAMVSTMVLHKRSAIPEGVRRATLNQEMVRRMLNTSEEVNESDRLDIIDGYAQKLINSEYTIEETRKVIVGGLKGYERLLSLSQDKNNPRWKPLHMAGSWNSRNRRMAKLRSRDNWFKGKTEIAPPPSQAGQSDRMEDIPLEVGRRLDTTPPGVPVSGCSPNQVGQESSGRLETKDRMVVKKAGNIPYKNRNKKRGPGRKSLTLGGIKKQENSMRRKLKRKVNIGMGKAGFPASRKKRGDNVDNEAPISVLFVDNTAKGILARRIQDEEKKLGRMTGYRIRVAESAGMPLSRLLPSTNPWGSEDCEREDCVPCSQGDEKRINCKIRNILYENKCTVCNEQDDNQKKNSEPYKMDGKGVYVGESGRSLYERSKEHEKEKNDKMIESHQIKHWQLEHKELDAPPRFKFSIVNSFKDPLTRQLAESVRIERRGMEILNSRSEYSRCRVPRLQIDQEPWLNRKKDKGVEKSKEDVPVPAKPMDDIPEETWNRVEDEARRLETKRKGTSERSRPKKKRKFAKLEGWGDPDDQDDVEDKVISMDVGPIVVDETVIDKELKKMKEPSKTKLKISAGVRKAKFNFKQKGKLRKDEILELRRSNINVFSWMAMRQEEPRIDILEDENDDALVDALEKEERLERVRLRMKAWEAKQAVKGILDGILVAVYRNQTVMEIKSILEEVTVMAEMEGRSRMIFSDMLEFGLVANIKMKISKEDKRIRLQRKLEMETIWLSRRSQKKTEDDEFDMEWEEHSLEACLAMLAIEAWDMSEPMAVDELGEEEDWLEGWIRSEEGLMIMDRSEIKEMELEGDTMDNMEIDEEEKEYMTWLMDELRELKLEDEILECIRNMRCEGDCDDRCQDDKDECVRSIHCPGECAEICRMPGYTDGSNNANQSEWHTCPGTGTAALALSDWKSSQECKVGSVPGLCVEMDGSNLQTSQGVAVCGETQKINHYLGIETQGPIYTPEGAVHELVGAHTNDIEGVKYCPGGELPRYEFISNKPSCSRREDWRLKIKPVRGERGGEGGGVNTQTASMRNIVQSEQPDLEYINKEFSAINIKELINSWENKERNILVLEKEEGEGGKPRRKSENFVHLSNLFEMGSIGKERGEAVTGADQGCDNPMYEPTNFSQNSKLGREVGWVVGQRDILPEANFKSIIFNNFSPGNADRIRVSRVLRQYREEKRGALPLAETTSQPTNRKRARDSSAGYPILPETPIKKLKSDHI